MERQDEEDPCHWQASCVCPGGRGCKVLATRGGEGSLLDVPHPWGIPVFDKTGFYLLERLVSESHAARKRDQN